MRRLASFTVAAFVLGVASAAVASSPCDARKVTALVAAKRATAGQLGEACKMPPKLLGLLTALDTTTESGNDDFIARLVDGGGFIEPVCPEYKDVFRDFAHVHPTRRSHHLFKRCALAKTGYFAEPSSDQLKHFMGMLGPPALEAWLRAAGEPMARQLAEAFRTVAVPDAKVPKATSTKGAEPVRGGE